LSSTVASCNEPPDPCKDLLQAILDFIKNLQKRYWDLKNNEGNLPPTTPAQPDPRYGTRSIQGEQHQFNGRQQGLRNRMNEYRDKGCGDPPSLAWEWAYKKVPVADLKPPTVDVKTAEKAVVATGLAVGTGYLIYRIIRMIPSVAFPPLWPTIPANAAIP
jgi:hypothetical protein